MSLLEKLTIGQKLEMDSDDVLELNFWRNSFDVDQDYAHGVDGRGQPVITKYEYEASTAYESRKNNFVPRNYCGHIIKKYNGYVFRNAPSRANDNFVELYKDVDLARQSVDRFFSKALQQAQIDGEYFVMIDTTQSSGIQTYAQSKQTNARPFLRGISYDSVVDYEEQDGHILEIVILFNDVKGNQFARYINTENFADITLSTAGVITSVSELMPHSFSDTPVCKISTEEFSGGSQIASIAEAQKQVNNYLSELRLQIAECTFTRVSVIGAQQEIDPITQQPIARPPLFGAKRVNWFPDKDVRIESSGNSDTQQTDSLRAQITEEVANLYRTAGLASPDPLKSNAPESGVAKEFAFKDTATILEALSTEVEHCENYVFSLIAELLSEPYEPVEYSREYDLESPQEALIWLRDILALDIPEQAKVIAKQNFLSKFLKTDDDIEVVATKTTPVVELGRTSPELV